MKFFAKLTLGLAAFLGILMIATSGTVVLAADPTPNPNANAICNGVQIAGGDCSDDANAKVGSLLTDVINIMSWIVGVVAIIVVIIGGLYYVTAAGNSERASKGQKTVLFALIGLVVVLIAQILVRFVINKVG
jgi:hypothetical protein